MSEQGERKVGEGIESLVFDRDLTKFKSTKDIPNTSGARDMDRIEAHVIGNVVAYEYGPDKSDKLGMRRQIVRVIEVDTVVDVRIIGRATPPLPKNAAEGQTAIDQAVDSVIDKVNAGELGEGITASRTHKGDPDKAAKAIVADAAAAMGGDDADPGND